MTMSAQHITSFLFQTQTKKMNKRNENSELLQLKDEPRDSIRHPSDQSVTLYVGVRSAKACMTGNCLVVFLSNIHIHCSCLSSLMPPTSDYFSEDEHFTPKALNLIQFTNRTVTIQIKVK